MINGARSRSRRLGALLPARGWPSHTANKIGSRMTQDLIPAKRLGMRTGLFAGDKASLQATAEQMKDVRNRPDVLLTELNQIAEVL